MAYNLYTQSFGRSYANTVVEIREQGTGKPATLLADPNGSLLNRQGLAVLDGNGDLNVYLDTSLSWTVSSFDGDTAAEAIGTLTETQASALRSIISGSFSDAVYSSGALISFKKNGVPFTVVYTTGKAEVKDAEGRTIKTINFDGNNRVTGAL